MKTITEWADSYVGYPEKPDEDSATSARREAYKAGMNAAFGDSDRGQVPVRTLARFGILTGTCPHVRIAAHRPLSM